LTVDELVHPGAAKLPPLADADPAAAATQPAEAGRLLDEIAVALGELDDDDFVLALRLFRPALIRRLFAWLDAAGPAGH